MISVIIPCYNQAHFLAEAIESVIAQMEPEVEIIVVDDGSTDHTRAVAARYPQAHYLYQRNQGLSAARNTGLRHSVGRYLVFLDADDRLLPGALEHNRQCLEAQPECAFAFGRFRLITREGIPYETHSRAYQGTIDYKALLQGNHIGMHATVMYRREVFEAAGGFNTLLRACEDYDLYLRITRQFPIASHDHVVADYRQHDLNMSYDYFLMLSVVLSVLRTQRPHLHQNSLYQKAYRKGLRNWLYYYSQRLVLKVYACLKAGEWRTAVQTLANPLQRLGQFLFSVAYEKTKDRMVLMGRYWRRLSRLTVGQVDLGELRRVAPLKPGSSGQSIECYYQERFLSAHAGDIQGEVIEVGGVRQPSKEAPPITFVSDLACLEELAVGSYDCIILPQVLQGTYELRSAIQTVYNLLKPGGVVLATVPGINLNKRSSLAYWGFTSHLVQKLWTEIFPTTHLTVKAYGNVLAATALLHQLPANELCPQELDLHDPHYQLLIAVRAVKPEGVSASYDK